MNTFIFTHYFSVISHCSIYNTSNRIIHEADEDVEDGYEGTTQKVNLQSPGSHHPNLMQMPEPMNDLPVFYQNEGGQMLKSGAEEDGAPTKTDMDQAGYVMKFGLQTRQSIISPKGDLWYIGDSSNGVVPVLAQAKSLNHNHSLN